MHKVWMDVSIHDETGKNVRVDRRRSTTEGPEGQQTFWLGSQHGSEHLFVDSELRKLRAGFLKKKK